MRTGDGDVIERLVRAMAAPITAPGSEEIALAVLAMFEGAGDLLSTFADKVLATRDDGERHDCMVVSPGPPHAVVLFIAWSGTHHEAMPLRIGSYLSQLMATANFFLNMGMQLAGLLEVDAYVRGHPDGDAPVIDVEYSFVPGRVFGTPREVTRGLPTDVLLNHSLCSAEERQMLDTMR